MLLVEFRQEATMIKNGKKVYTTDVIVATQESARKKEVQIMGILLLHLNQAIIKERKQMMVSMNIPDDVDDELPFN